MNSEDIDSFIDNLEVICYYCSDGGASYGSCDHCKDTGKILTYEGSKLLEIIRRYNYEIL